MTAKLAKKSIKPARRAPPPRPEPVEEREPDELEEDEFEPEDLAVAALLEELGGTDAEVRIYRELTSAKDLELMDTMPVSDFDPMMLASGRFGGGTFRIHARSGGGLKVNRRLKVARKMAPIDPNAPAIQAQNAAPALTPETLIAAIRAAFPPTAAPSRADILAEMKLMGEILRPAGSEAAKPADPANQFNMLREMVTFAKSLVPGAEPLEPKEPDFVSAGMSMIEKIMAAKMREPSQPVAALPAPAQAQPNPAPGGAADGAATDPNNPTPEEQMKIKILLEFALNKACASAEAGDDPGEYADEIFEDIPADVLRDMRSAPDWFDNLCGIAPACAKFKPWFEQVRIALLWFSDHPGATFEELPPFSDLTADGKPVSVSGIQQAGADQNGAAVRDADNGGAVKS